jgi:D-alanine-D-alanine ligase
MNKTRIALIYGGRSVEHGVSINSARNIAKYIDKSRFEPFYIGITESGQWHLTEHIDKNISAGESLSLSLTTHEPSFVTPSGKILKADVIFPILHGTDGEDGSVQGLFKVVDLPMVGTGVLGSAISMSKVITKKILKEAGLPVSPFLYGHFNNQSEFTFDRVRQQVGLPFMVKSASLGSSVGVSKVNSQADFEKALSEAFRFDDVVLFETYIKGREVECAILGNYPPETSLPGEIIISHAYEFYTFDAKYVDPDAVKIEIPANVTPSEAEKIRTLSLRAYQELACEDFARVDLFLTENGEVFINEINTIPGFTNSSMYPMMWKERGIGFTDLISRLIDLALERYRRGKRLQRDYQSGLNY